MLDDKGANGAERRIMHGWATIGTPPPVSGVPYWEQAHSIPRVITITADRLFQEPIPELQVLRYDPQELKAPVRLEDEVSRIEFLNGDALEISATIDRGSAEKCGLIVRADEQGAGTQIWIGAGTEFGIENCRNKHFLKKNEVAELHIFVDRGVLEVYCNGAAVTHKCFASADTISVFAFGEKGT
ncbi:MAG: GH32 C-terminal domain-containing protein, partial [Deltaproteobacteria bacterium]|nr:GH32 C-terminal domain-containing protein [Deltaproteobacteria bacterium]